MSSAKRWAVALRHVAFENAGLLAPILEDAGWSIAYCDAPTDDLDAAMIAQADLLIVLGGPIGVYEVESYPFLAQEIALLERRLAREQSTLGICLGSQLMAKALGARVFAGPVKEIGWGPVTLTADGRQSCLKPLADDRATVLHWHGDTFDLPPGAVRLASTAAYENQAFSHGRHALALQFHLEVEPRQLEAWYVGHTAELAAARISVPSLRSATVAAADGFRAQARRVFGAWLEEL